MPAKSAGFIVHEGDVALFPRNCLLKSLVLMINRRIYHRLPFSAQGSDDR
jgi:hypothetical protein